MDFTRQLNKVNPDINIVSNKVAQQEFEPIRAYIIREIERILEIDDLEQRLTKMPTKKGRPLAKKNVYIKKKQSIIN